MERGAAKVQGALAAGLGLLTQPLYDTLESATGAKPLNIFESWAFNADARARAMAPDPLTTGAAGQLLNGLGDVLAQVGIGSAVSALSGGTGPGAVMASGAATAGLSTGRATYSELKQRGVDASTAVNAGFVDAVMTGAGVAMPAAIGFSGMAAPVTGLGLRLTQPAYYGANAALGAGANVAMGITQRSTLHDVLQSAGYEAMATQYAPIDAAAATAEAVLGGVFGLAGARAGLPMRARDVVDGAMVARDARHRAIDTAPGAPVDPVSSVAHAKALDEAVRATWEGRPVDVSQTGVDDAEFLPLARDLAMVASARETHLGELNPQDRYVPSARLADLPVAQRVQLRYDAAELNEYAALVEQQMGLPPGILNAIKNAGERSNSDQVSTAGARGVMQFIGPTAEGYGLKNATDPVASIEAAGRYMADLLRRYDGNLDAAITEYNGGVRQAREVAAGGAPWVRETVSYLARVKRWLAGAVDTGSTPARSAARTSRRPAEVADEVGGALGGEDIRGARTAEFAAQAADSDVTTLPAIALEWGDADIPRLITQDTGIPVGSGSIELDVDAVRASQITEPLMPDDWRALPATLDAPDAVYRGEPAPDGSARVVLVRNDPETGVARVVELRPGEAPESPARAVRYSRIAQADTVRALDSITAPTPPRAGAVRGQGTGQPATLAGIAGLPARGRQGGALPDTNQPQARAALADPGGALEGPVGRGGALSRQGDDLETRAGLALIDEQGDIVVPAVDENGNEVQISLREALAEADAELEHARPEAFNAAVLCQMKGGV